MSDNKREGIGEDLRKVVLDPSTPSVSSIFRVVVITLAVIAAATFLAGLFTSLSKLILLLVLSTFFAYLLDPLVRLIRRPFKQRHLERFMPRALAIVITYVIVFSVIGVAIGNLAPRIADQGAEFAKNFPAYAAMAQEKFKGFNDSIRRMRLSKGIEEVVNEKIESAVTVAGERVTEVATGLVLNVITYSPWLFLVPILSFFLLKDVATLKVMVLRTFPTGRWRSRAEEVLQDANKTLAAYTRAQLLSCLLIGTVCFIGFYLMGVKYALLFGILAGVLEFIPLIGPLTVGLAVTGVTALSDTTSAVYVAAFLIVIRIIHDYVTYPRIIREGIHLHPLAIIISILAGEQIAGILGVFLSIPVVALATVMHRHILEHSGAKGLFTEAVEGLESSK
jgi:predicted PurR-regulated permease PerM